MAPITVTHQAGQAFLVQTRQHTWSVDQPSVGGEAGPTPVELLVSALASCVAHYAVGYLREHELPFQGLQVQCRWTVRPDPARLGRVRLSVHPPADLTDAQRRGLLSAVDHCTVHNSLRQPPEVDVHLVDQPRPAAMPASAPGGRE